MVSGGWRVEGGGKGGRRALRAAAGGLIVGGRDSAKIGSSTDFKRYHRN